MHRSPTRISRRYRLRLAGTAAAAVSVLCGSASAEGRLDAHYVATLAGIQIGMGTWTIDIGDDQFSAAATGMTAGLLRVFTTGEGSSKIGRASCRERVCR